MKKFIISALCLLVTLGMVIIGNTKTLAASNNNITMNGKAYLGVPEKDWKSFKQVKEVNAKMDIANFEIESKTINIDGIISYNGVNKPFNISTELKKSRSIDGDLVFNSEEDTEIQLVHGSIRYNTPEKKVLINKKLTGKTTLTLYLFDKKTRDLIMFEQPLQGHIKDQLEDIDYLSLEKSLTDTWAHKVVGPTVVNDSNMNISVAEDWDTAQKTVKYWTAWGDTTHSAKVTAHAHTSDSISDQGYIFSSLTLEQYVIPGGETQKEYGWSNIWIGRDIPVSNQWTLYDGQTGTRDMISKLEYSGNWSSNSLSNLSIGVSYGPISYGYSFKDYVTIPKNGFHNVYEVPGTDKPYQTEMTFTGTYLYDSSEKYYSNIYIITQGNEGEKSAQSWWRAEFYDSYNSESLGTEYLSAWLYYNSHQTN